MEENMYKEARILVVDDIEEVLSATKSTLKFEGMNVITYSNPKEALEFLKNNKIDEKGSSPQGGLPPFVMCSSKRRRPAE